MTVIYDSYGNFLVASLDGEETTYKQPILELGQMADSEKSLAIVSLSPYGLRSISGNTKLARGSFGEIILTEQSSLRLAFTNTMETKLDVIA